MISNTHESYELPLGKNQGLIKATLATEPGDKHYSKNMGASKSDTIINTQEPIHLGNVYLIRSTQKTNSDTKPTVSC